MSRTVFSLWLAGSLLAALGGCAHMVESKAIEAFATALQEAEANEKQSNSEKIAHIRKTTSDGFEKKALRIDEAVEDLRILKLPTEKPEIVSVEDVSDTEKFVIVEIEKTKKKYRYKLVKDDKSRRWVVDDVYMKQKKDGITATKSVTEQMDLLLSVREFLRAWDSSDRKDILAVTAPTLRTTLDALPPAYLAQVARQVVGDASKQERIKPEAQIDDDVAVVKVPRKTGQILLNMKHAKGHWVVTDLAVEGKGEDGNIPSVQKHAIALTTAVSFLQAYSNEDRTALATLCTDRFYRSGLAPADLKSVPMPSADIPATHQRFRIIAKRAELVIPGETEQVKVSLIREDGADADVPVRYRVEDVTLSKLDGTGERRLSSMFTSDAMLELFTDALGRRDLPMLRKTSTADFNRRVWDRLKQAGPPGTVALSASSSHTTIDDLPLGEIPSESPRVLETQHKGPVTEIKVRQGKQELTYILRENGGEVRVDDVYLPTEKHARSLKETTELIVPLREFAAGLAKNDIRLIQKTSSKDYNRLVWSQTDKVPASARAALELLEQPISNVKAEPESVTITLGDERWGARVILVKEYSQHVVDDVFLIQGVEAAQRMRLKQTMRLELAGAGPRIDTRSRTASRVIRDSAIIQGNYEEYADEPGEGMDDENQGLMPPDPSDDAFRDPEFDSPAPLPAIDAIPMSEVEEPRAAEPARLPRPTGPRGQVLLIRSPENALDEMSVEGQNDPVEPASRPTTRTSARKPR